MSLTYPWQFDGTSDEWYAIPFEDRLKLHDNATRDYFEPTANPDNSNYVALAVGSAISTGVPGLPEDRVARYIKANYDTKSLALFGDHMYLAIALEVEMNRYPDAIENGRTCSFTGFAQVVEEIMARAVSYGKGKQIAKKLQTARPTIWTDYLTVRDAYAQHCVDEALKGERPNVDAANLEYGRVTFPAECREQVQGWQELAAMEV